MRMSLGKIENRLVRSLTAAANVGSAVVMASALVLGVTKSKDESAYKAAVYASLIGIGAGAIAGSISTSNDRQEQAKDSSKQFSTSLAKTSWENWRNFVVVRKVKESEEITSFYLKPEDQGEIPNFQPGQFLTIKLNIPEQAKPVIRTYSLSDYSQPQAYYRLSIKREPMPAGLEVPPGIASNFMHDHVHEGTVILVKPPSGNFVLDVQKSTPVVLVSNGVGITPMISMVKAVTLLNPDRSIRFFHGARDGSFHAFREEVSAIAQQNLNLVIHFAYSRPRPEDIQASNLLEQGHYHSVGYVDSALIQSMVMQDAEYFICGSTAFMESIREGLRNAGVPESRVFFEAFTKAAKAISERPVSDISDTGIEEAEVVFARSKQTIVWDSNSDNLLEFAEANDLNPDYSCRQGICGTCACKILEGEVEYQETPTAEVAAGSALICISKPKTSRVVLDL